MKPMHVAIAVVGLYWLYSKAPDARRALYEKAAAAVRASGREPVTYEQWLKNNGASK